MPNYRLARIGKQFYAEWYEGAKRRRRSLGKGNAAHARRAFNHFVEQRERLLSPQGSLTVEQIFQSYLEDRRGDIAAPERLEHTWKSLGPHFGELLPDQIDRERCRSYTEKRRKQGRSEATIYSELGDLRTSLRFGEKMGWIKAPHIWRPPAPKPRERYITKDEARRLLDGCQWPHIRLFIALAIWTGGRSSAILGLTWDRVDLDRNLIYLSDPEMRRPAKKRATVPINEQLRGELEAAYEIRTCDHVIEWGSGPVKSVKRGFQYAVRKAGVGPCTPHVLRHSAAVWMAEAGVGMAEIASFLGHSNSRITEAVYVKFSPDHLRKASEALEI